MTERLTQRMHDETRRLDVPPPDAAAVLARGRRVRGRRRLAAAGSVVAAAVLVGAVVTVTGLLGGTAERQVPAGPPGAAGIGVAYSVENTIYLRGGEVSAELDEGFIKTLRYTSLGVLVEHGDDRNESPEMRPDNPQLFSLVRSNGTIERLDLELTGTPFGTDVTQPRIAYTEADEEGALDLVVADLGDGAEKGRVPLPPQAFGFKGQPPTLDLDGDTVWVSGRSTAYAVAWRTGEVEETRFVLAGVQPQVSDGRTVLGGGQGTDATIEDRAGEVLARNSADGPTDTPSLALSPDGRAALQWLDRFDLRLEDNGRGSTPPIQVVDLRTGARQPLIGPRATGNAFEWSADGNLFRIDPLQRLTTCSAATGECVHTQLDLPRRWERTVRYPDDVY